MFDDSRCAAASFSVVKYLYIRKLKAKAYWIDCRGLGVELAGGPHPEGPVNEDGYGCFLAANLHSKIYAPNL